MFLNDRSLALVKRAAVERAQQYGQPFDVDTMVKVLLIGAIRSLEMEDEPGGSEDEVAAKTARPKVRREPADPGRNFQRMRELFVGRDRVHRNEIIQKSGVPIGSIAALLNERHGFIRMGGGWWRFGKREED